MEKKRCFLCYLRLTPVRNLIGYLVLRMIGDTAIHVSGDYGSLQSVWGKKKGMEVDTFTVIHLRSLLPVV